MKKFKVTETTPATLVKVYEVIAHDSDDAIQKYINDEGVEISFQVTPYDDDAEFEVEDLSSEFAKAHLEKINEFYAKFDDLLNEYHPNLYLMNGVYRGAEKIKWALLDELNKDK